MSRIFWGNLGVALFVDAHLALGVGWILTTITNGWSFVACYATAVTATSLAGWTLLGYVGRLITSTTHHGEAPSNRARPRA